jgi:tight adherence protein B
MMVLKAHQQNREISARVDAILRPHRSNWEQEAVSAGIGRIAEKTDLAALAMKFLGHEPRRRPYYPLKLAPLLVIATVPGLIIGFIGTKFLGVLGWVVTPLTIIWFCRAFHGWSESRTQRRLFEQFPDALATIVRTVRVGLPVVEALRIVAKESQEPTAREFNALVEQTAIGIPIDEALRDMATLSGLPEYRFFATALSLQNQTGGALSETLENLADTIRKRVAIRMRGHALAAEARMSAYILGALPIVTGALLAMFNPGYISVLFTDSSGRMLLFVGIGMLTAGALTMRTMIIKSLS